MWFISVILFVVDLIMFFLFLLNIIRILLLISLVLLTVASVLYTYSNRKLKLDGGYTAVQALFFFAVCRTEKTEDDKKTMPQTELLRKTADRYDFSKHLSDEEIAGLYREGKNAADMIKNRKI